MKKIITLTCSLILIATISFTQPGAPDSTFNDSGKVIGFQFGTCTGLALQKDGKIVFGGSHTAPEGGFYIARYLKDGIPDPDFGENGFVYSPPLASYIIYSGTVPIQIQKDGKILTAAVANKRIYQDNILLVRYLENGDLDSSFGENGVSNIDFGYDEIIRDLALQEDGKIVVSGTAIDYSGILSNGFLLARYNSDGSVDNSFGDGGKIVENDGDAFTQEGEPSVCIQPDGKIITALPIDVDHNSYFQIVRHMPDGRRDSSFGENGQAIADFNHHNNDDQPYDITLQSDGKILATGMAGYEEATRGEIAVVRFNKNGTLDQGFGNGGLVSTRIDNINAFGYAVSVQPNNKILVTGELQGKPQSAMILLRYLPDGRLDSGFAENGYATLTASHSYYSGTAVELQDDGNIVVGGTAFYEGLPSYFVARYLGDPTHPLLTKIKKWIRKHILNFEDTNPNAVYYVIEKSTTAAGTYIPVTKINATKANTVHSYPLAANIQAARTTDYYRIKTVNKDNSVSYTDAITDDESTTKQINKSTNQQIHIYPNPAKDKIYIQSTKEVTLRLQNGVGQVITTQKIKGSGSMDISKLAAGVYYVIDVESGESYKIIKQ